MKKKKICSIILARGGSKGIKNKNLVLINDKPLIYYAIKASLESNVDETWLSSDREKILKDGKSQNIFLLNIFTEHPVSKQFSFDILDLI